MGASDMPVIVIELVLVLGGVLAFAWWQLRDLDRERDKRRRARESAPPQPPAEDRPAPPKE